MMPKTNPPRTLEYRDPGFKPNFASRMRYSLQLPKLSDGAATRRPHCLPSNSQINFQNVETQTPIAECFSCTARFFEGPKMMPTWFGPTPIMRPTEMICGFSYVFSYVGNLQARSDVCGVQQQSDTFSVNIPPYHLPN